MKNIYLYYVWKHPLLWITFPLWLLLGIIAGLATEQGRSQHRH